MPCPGVSASLYSAPRAGAEKGAGSLDPASHALLLPFPFSCPHCSSSKGVPPPPPSRPTFVASPGECLGRGGGAQSADLGSQGGDSIGQNLGKIKMLLSKVRSHCLSSSQRLWRGSVWDTRPSLCPPPAISDNFSEEIYF